MAQPNNIERLHSAKFILDGFKAIRPGQTRIGVAGDLVLGANAEAAFAAQKLQNGGLFEEWVHGLDLFIITLDSTFPGTDLKPWGPHAISGVRSINSIPLAKQTLFNLGNNHVFDSGVNGYLSMVTALKERHIQWVGAGLTSAEAESPWLGEIKGQLVQVFSVVHYGCHPRQPLAEGGQVAYIDSSTWWQNVRKGLNKEAFSLVLIHGGIQGSHYPAPKAVEISDDLIRMGANAVIWSHAHVIQGIRPLSEGLIAYGLGNAIHLPLDEDPVRPHLNPEYDRGLFIEIEPDPDRVKHAHGIFTKRTGTNLEPLRASDERVDWFNLLSTRPQKKYYPIWWRMYRFWQDVVLHSLAFMRRGSFWQQLSTLRPIHLIRMIQRITNARPDSQDV